MAVFIDGLNERCNGHPYQDELPYIFSLAHNQRGERAADWIILALSQLPVVRAINKIIVGWPQANYTNSNCTIETLKDMWKSRLRIRASLCQAFDIKCFSFLQPLAGVHGKHDDFGSLDQVGRSRLSDVYQGLRSLDDEDWFDISDSLNDLPYHGYVDNVHYSPAANQRIAGAVARMIASQVDKPNEVAQSQALPRFSPVAASD